MSSERSPDAPATSYVEAQSRAEAIEKMVRSHPWLSILYSSGSSSDGKAGWVNAIKDQRSDAYRLLMYIHKLRVAAGFQDRDAYEVLYDKIGDDDDPNYPRMLFTMSGAINLMRDGIPSERFALDLLHSELELVPYERGKEVRVETLRKNGNAYIGIYDQKGQGIRFLDLLKFHEIFDTPDVNEIQVHSANEVVVGDTKFVRPFLIRYAPKSFEGPSQTAAEAAATQIDRSS